MAGHEEPRLYAADIHADIHVDIHANRRSADPTTHQYRGDPGGGSDFFVRIGTATLHLDDDYAERLVIMLQAARNGEFTEPHEQSFESDTLGAATE